MCVLPLLPPLISARIPPRAAKFAPVEWRQYFSECQDVNTPRCAPPRPRCQAPASSLAPHLRLPPPSHLRSGDTFRLYLSGTEGPVIYCLHGAGYTGLTWALVAFSLKEKPFRVAAVDLRGHGETQTSDPKDLSIDVRLPAPLSSGLDALSTRTPRHPSLSPDHHAALPPVLGLPGDSTAPAAWPRASQRLCQDVIDVWGATFGAAGSEAPPCVLVGHSMGGAVAAHVAKQKDAIPTLQGLVVVDVVEGGSSLWMELGRGWGSPRAPRALPSSSLGSG